jgi:PAS domain-containing protein
MKHLGQEVEKRFLSWYNAAVFPFILGFLPAASFFTTAGLALCVWNEYQTSTAKPFAITQALCAAWVLFYAFDLDAAKGKILILKNVTERHLADVSFRESELRYRTLLEMTPFPILIIDHEANRIVCGNPALAEWARQPVEAIIGRNSVEFLYGHSGP